MMEVKHTTPYGPEEEYVGRRRRSSSLDLEDSVKKCNKRITHLKEHIMKELISLKNSQDKKERKRKKNYSRMDSPPNSYRTPPLRKRARIPETSPAIFSDECNSRRRRYEHDQFMGELINIKPLTFDGEVGQGE